MKVEEKNKILCRYIEHHCRKGYDFGYLLFKPHNYFDFEKIRQIVDKLDTLSEKDDDKYHKFKL